MLGKGIGKLGGLLTVGRLLQIASALVLIKFLTPAQMGAVGFLTAVFVGVYSLTNLGFDRYLIHAADEDIDASVVNNVWTLQLIRGLFVLLTCVGIAYTIPLFTDFSAEITTQLIFIGLALLIYNVANPRLALLEREGDFNQVANCRGLSMVGGALVILCLVYYFRSPWVYVVGKLADTLLYTLFTFYFVKDNPSLAFDSKVVKKIFQYCKHLFVISIVSVIAVQFENYYIAFAFGAQMLGFYFTWARLVYMPRELLAQISDRVLFAKACAAKRNNMALFEEHILVSLVVLALIAPIYAIIWFHGGWAISLLAGDAWVPYHWVGQFFVIISMFHMIALLFSPLVLANFPKVSSVLRSVEVFVMVILMLWLGNLYAIEGVLIASMIVIFLAMLIRIFTVYRYILRFFWYKHLSLLLFCIGLGLGMSFLINALMGVGNVNMYPGLAALGSYFVFPLLVGGSVWMFYRRKKLGVNAC